MFYFFVLFFAVVAAVLNVNFLFFFHFWHSKSARSDTRVYVLPLTELNLETPSNVYTNLVLTNPLEHTAPQFHHPPTHASTAPTTPVATAPAAASAFQWDDIASRPSERSANASQEYTTTSLTSPLKGVIPMLKREETQSIPIPGRTQSHDDIRMFGVDGSNSRGGSPRPNYYFAPISPTGQYTCNSPTNFSPPITNYGGNQQLHVGGAMVARRALSRAVSPLSHSVPSQVQYSSSPSSSSSCRTNAVKNCSRSDQPTNQNVFFSHFIWCIIQ